MKQLSDALLTELSQRAQSSPRRRANHNLHEQLQDSVQRLAVAMEPDTYVRPHRHPHTWELLTPLRGRFVVLHFDDAGAVTARTVLGEDSRALETPAGAWHAVLSLDSGGVILEVKHGPYAPIAAQDLAPWSAPAEDAAALARTLAWYAQARRGARLAP